ncbi:hypothetical protein KAW38_00670 [Candidatus Micrarchaeota archaeon]|nr:hypothetical protein [Candidatus Micrarchaeota archaeon]
MLKRLIPLLFLISILYSCSGEATIEVPALSGDKKEGTTIPITVQLINGKGNVYVNTNPKTSFSTQESFETAVLAGFIYANQNPEECDVLIDVYTKGFVEGPSGGAAVAVAIYSALTGEKIRNDATLTGGITPLGKVQRVGGIHEKMIAAWYSGKDFILIPEKNLYEEVMIDLLPEDSIMVYEITHLSEAIDFMIYEKELEQEEQGLEDASLPELEPTGISPEEFYPVAGYMIELETEKTEAIKDDEIRDYLLNEIENQNQLMELGYVYSAANSAFLGYVDAATISELPNLDAKEEKSNLLNCLESLKRPNMTIENYEWLIGADVREEWAQETYDKYKNYTPKLSEEEYYLFHELAYGMGWCLIAQALYDVEDNGTKIDETMFKEIAFDQIEELRETTDSEILWHISNARSLYFHEKYGAAAFEAAFARALTDAEAASLLEQDIQTKLGVLLNEERTSNWGRIYQSQALFLYAGNNYKSAYSVALFSKYLDNMFLDIEFEILDEEEGETGELCSFSYLSLILLLSYCFCCLVSGN